MWKILAGLALVCFSWTAAAQSASEDDVKAIVTKAAAHLKAKGVETACKDFADPAGGFIKGELYVYVHDMKAKMICHATNAKLNGKELLEMKDADGKEFNKEMVALVGTKGSGWVNYKFVNPVTKQIQPKSSFVQKEGDYIVGAGIYKH